MIGIINYGLGNLSSVYNAFRKVTDKVEIFENPNLINKYSKIILPGVGSFKIGMEFLYKKNWIKGIEKHIKEGKSLLGICLGMQLMFEAGDEDGVTNGLNFIKGKVKKMRVEQNLKLPHVGWNNLLYKQNHELLEGIKKNVDFYFVHSYSCIPDDYNEVLAEFNYGNNFVACVAKNNIIGTQFHPEKSLPSGLILIKNFINWRN